MEVRIVRTADGKNQDAEIGKPDNRNLPSITDGWRFNFKKHSKNRGFATYILTCKDTPGVIEGCLTFQMRYKVEPYMAYVEIAPHNRGKENRFDNVAGCLIAFACRLSYIEGKEHFRGWLTFDVLEEKKEDELKLMALYCKDYGAMKWGETTLVISPEAGEKLIEKFLNL
jgi:hypothetical protein